jgi:saccharopine dehydrogenase (NAD+, L-lysine-forming)
MRVMDAAIDVGASYQDMAAGNEEQEFVAAVWAQLDRDAVADAGLTALLMCGSAPGIANLLAREAVDKFDRVETIDFLVYEGVWTRQFVPFWWSPQTVDDMIARPVVYRDGEHVLVSPFNDPRSKAVPASSQQPNRAVTARAAPSRTRAVTRISGAMVADRYRCSPQKTRRP